MSTFLGKKRKKCIRRKNKIKVYKLFMYKEYLKKILLDQHNFLLLKATPIAVDSTVNVPSYFTWTNLLFCATVISIVILYIYVPDISLFNMKQKIYCYTAHIDRLSAFAQINFRENPQELQSFADKLFVVYAKLPLVTGTPSHTLWIYKFPPIYEEYVECIFVQNISSVLQFLPSNAIPQSIVNIGRVMAYPYPGYYMPSIFPVNCFEIRTPLCELLNQHPCFLWDYVFFLYAEAPTVVLKLADIVHPILWAILFKMDWTSLFGSTVINVSSKIEIEQSPTILTLVEDIPPLDILPINAIIETDNIDLFIEILLYLC